MTAYTRQLLFIRRLQEREYEKLKRAHPKDYTLHSTSKLNGLLAVEQTLIKLVDLEEASFEMKELFK